MIKDILLPTSIKNYYLFPKRILGFDIGKTHVSATQVYLKGTTITVEKQFQEPLEQIANGNYQEKVVQALQKILTLADKGCEVHTALSSSLAVFKTIKLPFTSHEKIALVVGYEIEPLLPFSLDDAVVDFIITKTFDQDSSAEILVAAVQKQHIAHHLQYFTDAGIQPEKVSIDLFDLYSLWQQVPAYVNHHGGLVLLDLGFSTTRIAFIYNGQLRMIRSLQKGTSRIFKMVSDALGISLQQASEKVLRFGLTKSDDHQYDEAIIAAVTNFWKEIQFTLNSFTAQDNAHHAINSILLLGGGAEIKELPHFASNLMTIPCELFSVMGILANPAIKIKNKHTLSPSMALSLGAALPSKVTHEFNLLQKEFSTHDTSMLNKQLIVAISLCSLLFLTLLGNSYLQKRKLKTEIYESEQEIVETLKKYFTLEDENDLEETIQNADRQLKQEQKTWFAFSNQARSSFLKYLLELHTLDKEALGLDVMGITIGDGALMLKAKVKDYEALKNLEKELKKSKLFRYIEPQEKTEFNMKITLAKDERY